jgi:hypothetical protein
MSAEFNVARCRLDIHFIIASVYLVLPHSGIVVRATDNVTFAACFV